MFSPARRMSGPVANLLILVPMLLGQAASPPERFQSNLFAVSRTDLKQIDAGTTVTRALPTVERSEVAVYGATRLNVSKAAFIERFRAIAEFKKSPGVEQIGVFSDPPTIRDLDRLTFDGDDFKARINANCGDDQSVRRYLLDRVLDYRAHGNASLGEYRDKRTPVQLAQEFSTLLDHSTLLHAHDPEIHGYLERYPAARPSGVEEFIYWSKERFGFKPVISITHVIIHQRANVQPAVFIASKQIFASHYFRASLGLTVLTDANPGTYLVYLNRSRIDAVGGPLGGLVRAIVSDRMVSGTQRILAETRRRLNTNAP